MIEGSRLSVSEVHPERLKTWVGFERTVAVLYEPWDSVAGRVTLRRLDIHKELNLMEKGKVGPRIAELAQEYGTTKKHMRLILDPDYDGYRDEVHDRVWRDLENTEEFSDADGYPIEKVGGRFRLARSRNLDRMVTAGPGFIIESSTTHLPILGESEDDPGVGEDGYELLVSRKPALTGPWITSLATRTRATVLSVHNVLAERLAILNDPRQALEWLVEESPFKDSPRTSWSIGRFDGKSDEQVAVYMEREGNKLIEVVREPYGLDYESSYPAPEILREIEDLAHSIYTPRGVQKYLTTPFEVFNGRTAMDLLRRGEWKPVQAELASSYTALGV